MNTQEIKNKLNSDEYDFLRNDKHLGNNIILLTTGGSHAYGTNVKGSDLDIRGITLENKNEIIGLSNFEQFENKTTDTTIYSLRKIFGLMLNCNPNTIEVLGTKDEHLFICNKYGKMIKDNVDLFMSKKAIHSFGGYATAQLRRLQNALARDNYPQPEKEQHILNTLISQFSNIEGRYKEIADGDLKLYIDKSEKEDYETEIFIDCNIKHYPLRDFKNIHSEFQNVIKDYDKLNGRNKKKDELHLNKHICHLFRLLIMGTEILEGKGVNTYRTHDLKFLMDLRNGNYIVTDSNGEKNYDYIMEMINVYQDKFKYASDNTCLPSKPNYKEAEELIMEIYKGALLKDE